MPKKSYAKKRYSRKTTTLTKKKILDIVHKGNMPSTTYKFQRTYRYFDGSNYSVYSSNLGPAYYALLFQLQDVPGYLEFVDLYDQYCIMKVVCTFYSVGTSQITTPSTNYVSNIITAIDYDDATVPSTLDSLLERSGCKINSASKQSFSVTLQPRVAKEIFKTTLLTGYATGEPGAWIDCANPDIPHYGLKIGVTEAPTNASVRWNLFIKYYLQFRNVR